MSDGREEREEQEQRRKWEKEHKDPDRYHEEAPRDWERDGDRERRDSQAVEAPDAEVRAQSAKRTRPQRLRAATASIAGSIAAPAIS